MSTHDASNNIGHPQPRLKCPSAVLDVQTGSLREVEPSLLFVVDHDLVSIPGTEHQDAYVPGTQGMSMASCETMFREQAYQDPGAARQQAARGAYDPAYLNDTMGKLMIRKLRADWAADHGGRAAWRTFHDRFLSYGGPPIPLVREQMLGTAEGDLF